MGPDEAAVLEEIHPADLRIDTGRHRNFLKLEIVLPLRRVERGGG